MMLCVLSFSIVLFSSAVYYAEHDNNTGMFMSIPSTFWYTLGTFLRVLFLGFVKCKVPFILSCLYVSSGQNTPLRIDLSFLELTQFLKLSELDHQHRNIFLSLLLSLFHKFLICTQLYTLYEAISCNFL